MHFRFNKFALEMWDFQTLLVLEIEDSGIRAGQEEHVPKCMA